jgi:hypothetical protein
MNVKTIRKLTNFLHEFRESLAFIGRWIGV